MTLIRFCLGASALGLVLAHSTAAIAADKPGSAYLQCDGQPNNVTDGETAARLLGAVTLLGLFAPPPEAADASKRQFGAAGVAACTSLIEGDRKEGNARRRLGLILGRAIHQIEAKNYPAAVADVSLARREADLAFLMNDAYFARSRGRAFDMVEAAALLRMDRPEDARAAALRNTAVQQYSLFGLLSTSTYDDFLAAPSDAEDRVNQWRSRLVPVFAASRADRLELGSRFADAARVRDALVEFDAEQSPETNSSLPLAQAAVAHALAGNMPLAVERATAARANAARRKAAGKPEDTASEVVELLDLFDIIAKAQAGDAKTARRLFAARSQWLSASLGSVLEVNRRLREGAAPDELIGGLEKDPAALWKAHVDETRAALLAKDSDNKTLFQLVPAAQSARDYQSVAKNVWRTDKSKIILKTKMDPAKNRMELMYVGAVHPTVAMDAYLLHAALIARSRGHSGFVFMPVVANKIIAGSFRSGNRGEKGFPDDLFIDANDVIARLSPLIPDPEANSRR